MSHKLSRQTNVLSVVAVAAVLAILNHFTSLLVFVNCSKFNSCTFVCFSLMPQSVHACTCEIITATRSIVNGLLDCLSVCLFVLQISSYLVHATGSLLFIPILYQEMFASFYFGEFYEFGVPPRISET